LVVQDPGEDVADAGEDAGGGEEDAGVARPSLLGGGEEDVAEGAGKGEEEDHEAALLGAVGDVGRGDGEEEGEKVGWGGEALGLDGGEAHLGEDGGEEDGEGGEGDVAGEVHQGGEVVLSQSG